MKGLTRDERQGTRIAHHLPAAFPFRSINRNHLNSLNLLVLDAWWPPKVPTDAPYFCIRMKHEIAFAACKPVKASYQVDTACRTDRQEQMVAFLDQF
jgi:hypothetical protein